MPMHISINTRTTHEASIVGQAFDGLHLPVTLRGGFIDELPGCPDAQLVALGRDLGAASEERSKRPDS